MPTLNEMLPSRFLKKEDVPAPVLVTISAITHEVVDKDTEEKKWAMHFEEFDKPLALNSTNLQITAKACGSQDSDEWLGRKMVLFTDDNVSFAGKIVGGLRLRAPKVTTNKHKPAPVAEGVDGIDEDIPF
jgi:hypothetical protein